MVDATVDGERAILLCPHTFMNKSGTSVVLARDFYKLTNEDLLIVCDDFNLPAGRLRFRARGSSGGQKGLEDTVRALGSDGFARLRIGIGPVPGHWDAADFVLGKFSKDERPVMDEAVVRGADAVAGWVTRGVDYCMNTYNG